MRIPTKHAVRKIKKLNKKEVERKKEAREYIWCIQYNKPTFPINFSNFRAFFWVLQV